MKTTISFSSILFFFLFSSPISIFGQINWDLPSDFMKSITATAYSGISDEVAFISQNHVLFFPLTENAEVKPEWYPLQGIDHINAALYWDEQTLLLFQGDQYIMLEISTGNIAQEWAQWPGLPEHWDHQLDAAVNWGQDLILFFHGNEYATFDLNQQTYVDFGNLSSWEGWPAHWTNGLTAGLNIGDEFIYFFKGDERLTFDQTKGVFIQPTSTESSSNSTANNADYQYIDNEEQAIQQEATSPTNWCTPAYGLNNGYTLKQTKTEGSTGQKNFLQDIPAGSRLAAVRVWTNKVWNAELISGLQLVTEDNTGQRTESAIVGRSTTQLTTVDFDEDECLTSIQGKAFGQAGPFIYALQFITTKKQSPQIGGKGIKAGNQTFSISIPEGGILAGFKGSYSSYVNSIGIQYLAAKGNAFHETFEESDQQQETSTTTSKNEYEEKYSDDYADHTENLEDDAFFKVLPLPGLEWLGAGFDILYYDPLMPNETKGKKTLRTIQITNSSKRAGNENKHLQPYGSVFNSLNSGRNIDTSTWVENYKSFVNSFGIGISGSVEVPFLASASRSASYSQINSVATGSESIYHFDRTQRKIHDIALQLFWRSKSDGKRLRQKLDYEFREDVAQLKVPASIPQIGHIQKDTKLPFEIARFKAQYDQLIRKYGTHFAEKVTYGGLYITRTEIKRADFEKSRQSKSAFKDEVSVQIKELSLSRTGTFDHSNSTGSSQSSSNFRRITYVSGGYGETILENWVNKVDNVPAPIELEFRAIADLLVEGFFPDDPDIQKKHELLKIFTEKYLADNMKPAAEPKMDFFRGLADLPSPGNISIQNSGGYVMKFGVEYLLNGESINQDSRKYPVGQTRNLDIPIGATDIKLTVYYSDGLRWKEMFTESFSSPPTKSFKVWGTIWKRGHAEIK